MKNQNSFLVELDIYHKVALTDAFLTPFSRTFLKHKYARKHAYFSTYAYLLKININTQLEYIRGDYGLYRDHN